MIALVLVLFQAAAARAPAPDFAHLSKQAEGAQKAGRNAEALRLYRAALRIKPAWTDGWWNTGSILYERGDYAGARAALRKLVALDDKAVAGYALLGICEYKTAEYDAALEHLDKARTLGLPSSHPLGSSALYYLALLMNRQELHDEAAALLLTAYQRKSAPAAVTLAIGLAGLRMTKLPEELTPAEKDLAAGVGHAMGAPEAEAGSLFEDLLKLHPDQPNLHYLYGIMLLLGDADRALAEFQKELSRDPRHVPSLLALTREAERRSEFEKARGYAERAVDADPRNFAAHAILGRVLVSLGKTEQGVRELERAREIEPGSPQVYFALASAYAKLGRTEDAERARAEFLRLKDSAR